MFDYVVGIHRREEDFFEKENAVQGIRSSINEWNPESKFLRQVIRNPLCGIHPESKDVLDFPIWDDCSLVSKVRNTAIFKINHVVFFRFSYCKGEDGVPGTDGNPGNQGDTVSCLLVLILLLKMFFCGSPCCSYKTVNILLSYFRDLVVCLEIQDHLEDLVHWYVVIIVIMMPSSMTEITFLLLSSACLSCCFKGNYSWVCRWRTNKRELKIPRRRRPRKRRLKVNSRPLNLHRDYSN